MTLNQQPGNGPTIDTSKASAIACLVVDDNEVLATLSLGHLMNLVPDPRGFEDKRVRPAMMANPAMAALSDKREHIQRYFTGAKKTNVPKYADFIFERVRDRKHRGTPPICLGTSRSLVVVPGQDGTARIGIPYGLLLLAVDGETQRAAWEEAHHMFAQLIEAGMATEDALESVRVPVEIHHGLDDDRLQALFYERNVLGAKVNANEAISKDQRDPAMKIVREIMNMPIEMPGGGKMPVSYLVQTASRQVAKNSQHWVTLSALRTGVVTTLLGRAGLQYGAKPVPEPDRTVDFDALKDEVAGVFHAVLQRYADKFYDKDVNLIGAPSILAGIGIAANRAITSQPTASGREHLTIDELFDLLDPIRWEKNGPWWEGVGTRRTPKGAITVAGPKEVGYAVADAIEFNDPVTGAKIRGLPVPDVAPALEVAEASERQDTLAV